MLNAQLFMGETVSHVGTWYICVKLGPDARYLIHILNTNPHTNPNTNTHQH